MYIYIYIYIYTNRQSPDKMSVSDDCGTSDVGLPDAMLDVFSGVCVVIDYLCHVCERDFIKSPVRTVVVRSVPANPLVGAKSLKSI